MTQSIADDRELDHLYTVAPAEFVAARNTLAKTLRASGRRAEAADVAKKPRPSSVVWAINQLARQDEPALARLAEATARLQRFAAGPGSGPGAADRAAYAAAIDDHREILKGLRARADTLLGTAGIRATPEILGAVVQALRSAMVDPAIRAQVAAGRLEREPAAEGLGNPFEGRSLAASPEASPPADAAPPAPSRAPAGASEAAARAEVRARQQEEAAAARARAQARAAAERRVAAARAAATRAAEAVTDEERTVAAAQEKLAEAEARLDDARTAATRAAEALATAERDLTALPG